MIDGLAGVAQIDEQCGVCYVTEYVHEQEGRHDFENMAQHIE
jgi:hypothetical protein